MEIVPSSSHIQSLINYLTRVILIQIVSTPNQNNLTIKKPIKTPYKRLQTFTVQAQTFTCYKCGKKGHTSRFYKVNTKLHELQRDE